ncbi:hypothetical protein ACRAWD_29625 [Caulobacter segnis]
MRRTLLAGMALLALAAPALAQPIDRHALVSRHDVKLTKVDPSAPLMVGNGQIGFHGRHYRPADLPRGLFQDRAAADRGPVGLARLPEPEQLHLRGWDNADRRARDPAQPYAYMRDWNEAETRPALAWLRENPHRFSLGRVALDLRDKAGKPAKFEDLTATEQDPRSVERRADQPLLHLRAMAVTVRTRVHPTLDMIVVDVDSALVAQGRLKLSVKFPGVSKKPQPRSVGLDPSRWARDQGDGREAPAASTSRADRRHAVLRRPAGRSRGRLHRRRGRTPLSSRPRARDGPWGWRSPSRARPCPRFAQRDGRRPGCAGALEVVLDAGRGCRLLGQHRPPRRRAGAPGGAVAISDGPERRWRGPAAGGGAVLQQLERQIPPRDAAWHAGHFALWNKPEYLERSLPWYLGHLKDAKARAASHGLKGAWWPRWSAPTASLAPSRSRPSSCGSSPPIWMSELVWRDKPTKATLAKYGALVAETRRPAGQLPASRRQGPFRAGPAHHPGAGEL